MQKVLSSSPLTSTFVLNSFTQGHLSYDLPVTANGLHFQAQDGFMGIVLELDQYDGHVQLGVAQEPLSSR